MVNYRAMAEEEAILDRRRRRALKMLGLTSVAGSALVGEAGAVTIIDDPATENEITVNVLVEDLDGEPIEGAIVELEDRGGSPDDRVGETDTDGRIRFIEGVGPPPKNCQTLKLKLKAMDRVKDIGCRNAPATVDESFQVDRDKLKREQDDTDRIPEKTKERLQEKEQLIQDIQEAADAGLTGSPLDGGDVDIKAESFIDGFEDNYLDADSEKRTQYAEGLKRLNQAEKITKKAVDSDGSVERLTREIANAGTQATIAIAAIAVANVGGAAAKLGSRGKLLESTVSEIKRLLQLVKRTVLGIDTLSANRADEVTRLYDGIGDKTREFLDKVDLTEVGEETLETSLGNSNVPPNVKSFILDQIDSNENKIGGPIYANHIFRVKGDIVNDNGTYDTGILPTRPGEAGVEGVHESIQDRTSDIENAIENSSIGPSKTLGEDPVQFPSNRIENQVEGANDAFNDISSLTDGLSIAEGLVVGAAIVQAVSKGTATKLFRQLSRLSAALAASYITLTAEQTVIGNALLGTVREEHDFGTNELINPENTGI